MALPVISTTGTVRLASCDDCGEPVTLVELTDDDFVAMLRGDVLVRPGIAQPPGGVDQPETLEHVRRLASRLRQSGAPAGHFMMVAGGEVVGLCGFKPPSSDGELELGYGVAESRRRRGHATAAVNAIIEIARENPSVRAIIAYTAIDNVASQKVLEHNAFARVAHEHDPHDGELILWRKRLHA